MVNQLGTPYWDGMHSVIDDEYNFEGYFIPLIKDSGDEIGGFIEFTAHGDHDFYHLDVVPASYTKLLDESLGENYVFHVILNVGFDVNLFRSYNVDQIQWLLDNYSEGFTEGNAIETRTIVIHYSQVIPLVPDGQLTGKDADDMNATLPGFTSGSETFYGSIHIDSNDVGPDGDPLIFDPDQPGSIPGGGGNVISTGNPPPVNPNFAEAILLLQMDCEETDDSDGAGTDSNSGAQEDGILINATMVGILEQWCYFKGKCLEEEFQNVPDLSLPIHHNQDYELNPNAIWASQLSGNTSMYLDIINGNYGCVTSDDLETIECIANNYDDFIATYNLDFTESEAREFKKALKEAFRISGCNDFPILGEPAFDEIAIGILLEDAPCAAQLESVLAGAPYFGSYTLTAEEEFVLIGPSGTADCGNMEEFREEIDAAVKTKLIESCVDHGFTNYILQLELPFAMFEDYCNELNTSNPVTCENCTDEQFQIILDAHNEALNLVECSINQLDAYDGSTPDLVKTCLETHFGGANSQFSSYLIKSWLKTIELVLKKQNYRIQELGEGLCDEGVDAWTLPGGIGLLTQSFITIRICNPGYFNDSLTEQAATIIHEAAHIGLSAGDLSYDWSPEYEELNTIQQMLNADSFSEISKCLCP